MTTRDRATRAGMMLKMLRLAASPGIDEIALRLNCDLTFEEQRTAHIWERALELADKLPDEANKLELQNMAVVLREAT